MVSGHLVLPEPLAKLVRHALGHPPGVHEHEGRPVLLHVLRDEIKNLRHLLGGGDRRKLVAGDFECEIELTAVPDVDDRTAR